MYPGDQPLSGSSPGKNYDVKMFELYAGKKIYR